MKKTFLNVSLLALASSFCLSLTSCAPEVKKIALIIDSPTVSDHSYQYGTYLALQNYLAKKEYKENENYKAFLPTDNNHDLNALVESAIDWGAEGVILNGYQFMEIAYDIQSKYPNIKFMIQDSIPTKNNDVKCLDNMLSVTYKEQELGYLAGYVTALDGYKNLGYIGGIAEDIAVVRFGCGYLAGIHQAMKDLNTDIKISGYKYIGSYDLNMGGTEIAKSMYDNKAEVIFAACGLATGDVLNEAERQNKMIIAPDIDQSYLSKNVLTSAIKVFDASIKAYLDRFFGKWSGGELLSLGIQEDAVGLPTNDEAWRFTTVTKEQYKNIYDNMKKEKSDIPSDYASLEKFVKGLGQEMQVTKADIEGK